MLSTDIIEDKRRGCPLADVVIIGAGIAGLSVAAELGERGVSVLVLDKDDIGFEQSARSTAGIALPEDSNETGASTLAGVSGQQWHLFESRWESSVELNREGWIAVAVEDADVAFFERDQARWEGDPSSTLLPADAARARYPMLEGDFHSLEVRAGGHVNPVLTVRALYEAGLRAGVEYRIGEMVVGFETSGETITAVRLAGGERVSSDSVIVAAGIWVPRLCDQLGVHIPCQRVRVPVGVTGPVAQGTVPGLFRAGRFGARQNADGTIRIIGGYRVSWTIHDFTFDDVKDLGLWGKVFLKHREALSFGIDLGVLRHDLARLFRRRETDAFPVGQVPRITRSTLLERLRMLNLLIPRTTGVRIQRWFGGVVEITPDLKPVMGLLPGWSNAYVSGGFSGHGFILGPGSGRVMADVVCGAEEPITDLADFRPERFTEAGFTIRDEALF